MGVGQVARIQLSGVARDRFAVPAAELTVNFGSLLVGSDDILEPPQPSQSAAELAQRRMANKQRDASHSFRQKSETL